MSNEKGRKRPPFSEEWRRKLGLAQTAKKGKYHHSEETKQKQREARIKYLQLKIITT